MTPSHYIPKFGDVSDVHMPWAYASTVDPKYFPKGAGLEQVDVMQLGKSVNFCVAPFDGAPLCKIWPVIKDMLFMPFFVCFFLDRKPCFFARAFFVKTIRFSEVFFCRKSWGGRGALMFGQSGGSESCFCYVSW